MSKAGQRRSSDAYPVSRLRAFQAIIVLAALVFVWLFAASPLGHIADNNASDSFFRWFPATRANSGTGTTLLAIDEATLSGHGGIRNLRPIVTQVAQSLFASPPRVLAIDLTLADDGDPREDAALAAALAKLPHVVMGAEIRSVGGQWEVPSSVLISKNTSIAHVHAAPDPMDAVCREIPLEKAADSTRYWALSLETFRLWRDAPYILETPSSLFVGAVEIPARRDTGRLMRIRFLPPDEQDVSAITRISVADVLAGTASLDGIRDGVVFLGVTAPSAARDRLMTPFSYGRSMQGVEIHANAFETLASGRFLRDVRPAVLLLGSLLLAGLVWWAFAVFSDNRSYGVAAVVLLVGLMLPPTAFVQGSIASATVLVGSAWLPFFGLAAHRYWFVNRKLKAATRETENYRNAIHYVTHEMRTPLTAIQGSSELISRYQLGQDKQREIATLIHSESKRLGKLIQVFLDVERLSAGEMQLRADRFPASQLIATCLDRARPLADAKEILLQDDSRVDYPITGDRELLEHALYNLVTNAVKYSPNGAKVKVLCRVNGQHVFLDVQDQGSGLTEAEQKAVFRKFYRTSSAEQSGVSGSGIGLSIVEQIISAHEGRVLVVSAPGKGSTFTLELPVAPVV